MNFAGNEIDYFRDNKAQLHREDGPAVINHTLNYKGWHINGQCHRENGPARNNIGGIIGKKEFWINQKQID